MGGHFELSKDGHPNRKNMRPIIKDDPNSRKVAHPEWVWLNGLLYFVGNPRKFLRSNYMENQLSYVRSGATMWQEGAGALVSLALLCYFCVFYTIGLMRSATKEKFSVCPSKQQLQDYCTVMTGYGGLCCFVCWMSCVRGAPRTKVQWSLLYFIAFGEFVTNCVGSVFVIQSIKNICSESAPIVFLMAAIAVFIWGWFTVLMVLSMLMYCRKKWQVYKEKRHKIMLEEEKRRLKRVEASDGGGSDDDNGDDDNDSSSADESLRRRLV